MSKNQKKYLLAPGSILQNMYIKSRLNKYYKPELKFIELGSGNSYISNILLQNGLNGIGLYLSEISCSINKGVNQHYVRINQYTISNSNFFDFCSKEKFDIIITSHVLEHLTKKLDNFLKNQKNY